MHRIWKSIPIVPSSSSIPSETQIARCVASEVLRTSVFYMEGEYGMSVVCMARTDLLGIVSSQSSHLPFIPALFHGPVLCSTTPILCHLLLYNQLYSDLQDLLQVSTSLRSSTDAKQNLLLFPLFLSSLLRVPLAISIPIHIQSLNSLCHTTIPLASTPASWFTKQSLPVLGRHTRFTRGG